MLVVEEVDLHKVMQVREELVEEVQDLLVQVKEQMLHLRLVAVVVVLAKLDQVAVLMVVPVDQVLL